jgi:DNA-binding NarL/FixJ family response regulator
MIEISEAFYQWQQGRSKLKIAESLGISRPTLRNYLNLALASGFSVSSSAEEVAAIARSVQSAVAGGRIFSAPVRDAIALHEERIKKLLSEPDMTAKHVLATSLLHRSTRRQTAEEQESWTNSLSVKPRSKPGQRRPAASDRHHLKLDIFLS